MMVIAPRMSPRAIIARVSSTGTQRTLAVSSTSGSPTRSAPRDRYSPADIGVADERLRGHDELSLARTPARFLFDFARCRRHGVFAVIHVAAWQLPHPAVHDEPVPPHQQDPLARVVQDHRHRASPHPEDVLREAHLVRKLDIGQAHTDVRGIVHESLALDHPLGRATHVRDTTGPASRRPATVDPQRSPVYLASLRYTWGAIGMPRRR